MTGVLGSVLLSLVIFALWGSVQTARTTRAQTESLTADALFSEVRATVALQQMHLRRYQIEPEPTSPAIGRHLQTAAATEAALERLLRIDAAREDAARLQREHTAYRRAADRLMSLIAQQSTDLVSFDRREVQTSHLVLQQDADQVSYDQHLATEAVVGTLRSTQTRILFATTVGCGIGLLIVAAIWRINLGYQVRLLAVARRSQRLALRDALTGLPNRSHFEKRLARASARTLDTGEKIAVLMIDLNRFKHVNDTLGHEAGDLLLRQAAQRMRRSVRANDLVARLGGDEFAVLIDGIAGHDEATELAQRINAALSRPFSLFTGPVVVGGSIGLAFGHDGTCPHVLMRRADAAMYRAKAVGGTAAVYEPSMETGDGRSPARTGTSPSQSKSGRRAVTECLGGSTI